MPKTSLYRHFDAAGALLYIGISKSVIARLQAHESSSHWANQIARVEIERLPTRKAALSAERKAIKSENPRHNIAHSVTPFCRPIAARPSSDLIGPPCPDPFQKLGQSMRLAQQQFDAIPQDMRDAMLAEMNPTPQRLCRW